MEVLIILGVFALIVAYSAGHYIGNLRGKIACCEDKSNFVPGQLQEIEVDPHDEEYLAPAIFASPFTAEASSGVQWEFTVEEGDPDNLRLIEGIGPVTENVLNEAGVSTYEQIQKAPVEVLENILAGSRFAAIKVYIPSWSTQAKLLAAGDFDAFHDYIEELKFGR